jgi:hypothetical protein
MARPRQRTLSVIMKELQSYVDERDRELAAVHAQLARALTERDDLAGQLRFALEQANRETRAAAELRAELLARTSVAHERLDFCCSDEHGETTAVLPRAEMVAARRRKRDDEDTLVTGSS